MVKEYDSNLVVILSEQVRILLAAFCTGKESSFLKG